MLIEAWNPNIDLIRCDRTRGASELAFLTLEVLAEHSRKATVSSNGQLLEESKTLAVALSECRPAIAPIVNGANLYRSRMDCMQAEELSLNELRDDLGSTAMQIMADMKDVRQRSIDHAAQLIQNGQCIASCSYSSTVIAALVQASQQGKQIRLIWPESRFNGQCYGTYSQNCLDEKGIPCQLVEDHEIDKAVQSADMLLLGADTVMPSGDFINGYPSLSMAKATRRSRGPIPVYCLADTSKILWDSPSVSIEPGLEKVPREWLESFITENGALHARLIKSLRISWK